MSNTDHIVTGNTTKNEITGKCLHCGRLLKIRMPVEVPVFSAAVKAFVKQHKNCKPRPKPR